MYSSFPGESCCLYYLSHCVILLDIRRVTIVVLIPEAHANVFFIRLHLKYSARAAVIFCELPSARLMV